MPRKKTAKIPKIRIPRHRPVHIVEDIRVPGQYHFHVNPVTKFNHKDHLVIDAPTKGEWTITVRIRKGHSPAPADVVQGGPIIIHS
jgi:hypothetical protein